MYPELFGSKTGAAVITYLCYLGAGHARGIAKSIGMSPSQVDRTVKRLENGGIVVGRPVGRTRQYEINPRLPFKKELVALVDCIVRAMSDTEREKFIERRRPRRTGKKI